MRKNATWLLICLLVLAIGLPVALGQPATSKAKRKGRPKENAQQRENSLRAIAAHLGVGSASVIADIGAGKGTHTWVFADIVGTEGKVFAEEIEEDKVTVLEEGAAQRNLSQVKAVIGTPTDPSLPANTVDMAFMHFVYHHVTQPLAMLKGIWTCLKPGGYLVVVDQRKGTLKDWVPREARGGKHFWIAETTVVREAREEGFRFVECAESRWHVKDSFVLVFQRPTEMNSPGHDPDPLPPIAANVVEHLLPARTAHERIAFVALGEGRKLIAPVLKSTGAQAVDIVLEEWATRKDERPTLPPGVMLTSVLTEEGDPKLGPESLDAVYFLDTYHLLFHGPALLGHLHRRLTPSGRIYILDRRAPNVIPHREASHRRMIAAETVKNEMANSGFRLLREGPSIPERFLLVFGKNESQR
jgi:predicted methyltransferase